MGVPTWQLGLPRRPIGVGGVFRYRVARYVRRGRSVPVTDWKFLYNAVTDEGLNKLGDTALGGVTQVAAWYVGLITNAGYSAIADADTMSSHAGWTEFTNYSAATRPQWNVLAAAAGVVDTDTTSNFIFAEDEPIKGFFVASDNTKGGTAGTLLAHAVEGSPVAVLNAQELQVSYAFTFARA